MGRKSTIKTLDPAVRDAVDNLLKTNRLTLDQVLEQIRQAFPGAAVISRSALGRYSKRFEEVGKRLRESREVAKVWVDRLGSDPQGDVGKMVMETLRTMAFDATLDMQERDSEVDPKEIATLALAMQRLESAGKWNLQREKEMRAAALSEAAEAVQRAGKKTGTSDETIDLFRREILGIVDEPASA